MSKKIVMYGGILCVLLVLAIFVFALFTHKDGTNKIVQDMLRDMSF
jgi:hypothetical protein